jgi:hypothetical protein
MRRVMAIGAVLTGLLLAGCGGDDDDPTTTADSGVTSPSGVAPPSGSSSPSAAGFPPAFIECMADKGVDVSTVDTIHGPAAQEAFYACLPYLHGGAAP